MRQALRLLDLGVIGMIGIVDAVVVTVGEREGEDEGPFETERIVGGGFDLVKSAETMAEPLMVLLSLPALPMPLPINTRGLLFRSGWEASLCPRDAVVPSFDSFRSLARSCAVLSSGTRSSSIQSRTKKGRAASLESQVITPCCSCGCCSWFVVVVASVLPLWGSGDPS